MSPAAVTDDASLYDHPDIYEAAFGAIADAEETAFYGGFFAPGTRLLVGACGAGRVSCALSDSGYSVSGFDLSGEMIRRAAENDPAGRYEAGDLVDPPFANERFGGALVPLLGFAELGDPASARMALAALANRLDGGGAILLELPVCHDVRSVQGMRESFDFDGGDYRFDYLDAAESNGYFTAVHFEIRVRSGERCARRAGKLAVYSPEGVARLFEDAGLSEPRYYAPGEFDSRCAEPPPDCLRAVAMGRTAR